MKRAGETNGTDPETVGLAALSWVLSTDQTRAERLLATTGLTPDALRAGLTDPSMLAAVLGFLEAHEPDLIACAGAIGETPEALVTARRSLDA